MRIRWQYSLRWALAAMALVAAIVAGATAWVRAPSARAKQFADAINSGDYARAEALCAPGASAFPGDWTKHATFQPKAHLSEWTWRDLWQGRRPLYVAIAYGDGHGLASCGLECVATRRGIEPGMMIP
jgi:hypothetical protein